MKNLGFLETVWRDLWYAVRAFRRNVGFTAVALLSLALGIGASTAIFSVVYGALIAPYPYAKPHEIWAPNIRNLKTGQSVGRQHSVREFLEIQKIPAFADAMATTYESVLLTGDRAPESFAGVLLSGNAFRFLGVQPVAGRTIEPSDIQPNGVAEPVVVLSYLLWRRLFEGDTNALGKTLLLNGLPHTVIGVMPPRFGWYGNDGFWLPLGTVSADDRYVNVIVRLQHGLAKEAGEQQLHALHERLASEKPASFPRDGFRTRLLNYLDVTVASGEMRSSLRLLFAAVAFLLLIACANVANLQLARTTARAREIAVRVSIGASRRLLLQQLLTESVVLSVAGGALGILFAVAATRAIVALMPEFYVPNEARIGVNGYALLFSLGVSIMTGIVFGLVPALQGSRPDLTEALKDSARGSGASLGGRRTRNVLVVTEVALAVVLLAGSALAIRSFITLQRVEVGFQPDRVLIVGLPLSPRRYETAEQRNLFAQNLLERVKLLPGVQAAAIGVGGLPFGGPRSTFTIEGRPQADAQRVTVGLISADYLQTLGIPLRRGRALTEAEVVRGDGVALINQAALRFWSTGEDPIGRRMTLDLLNKPGAPNVLVRTGTSPDLTVVGVIGNTKNGGLKNETQPAVFVPYTILAPPSRVLAVRTRGAPIQILNAVRAQVQEIDKEQPLGRPITAEEMLGFQTVQPRFNMALFTLFAMLGLALGAAGIYSVISYNVTRRTHEIGVRVALGAKVGDVLRLVLGMGARLVVAGLITGLGASFLLVRLVGTQIFDMASLDATTVLAVVAVLGTVALLACYVPARRAARLDPTVALRHE
jgi:putative ABC transport system permease protein